MSATAITIGGRLRLLRVLLADNEPRVVARHSRSLTTTAIQHGTSPDWRHGSLNNYTRPSWKTSSFPYYCGGSSSSGSSSQLFSTTTASDSLMEGLEEQDTAEIAEGGSSEQDEDSTTTTTPTIDSTEEPVPPKHQIRLSKLLSHHSVSLAISRREAERLIRGGEVTVAGQSITSPHYLVDWDDLIINGNSNNKQQQKLAPGIVKVNGKAVALMIPSTQTTTSSIDGDLNTTDSNNNDEDDTKIWIVHKLKGEVVADHDPQGRPSMMDRLVRGGVGRIGKHRRHHLKPIGRLDMMTEGLIMVTTCGRYAREMELPVHQFHRTYRVRVHGPLTQYKILALQKGLRMEDKHTGKVVRFAPMKVEVEGARNKRQATNCWIRMTCTEGKNRQIRNVLKHLGLTVTRLIRTSFGDYQLQTIPPGMALEVPLKELKKQMHKGAIFSRKSSKNVEKKRQTTREKNSSATPIQWIRHHR